MIYIKTNNAQSVLRQLGESLSAKEIYKASARAINRTLMKGRTQARTEVKKVYNIANRYTKGIDLKPSTPANLTGKLTASRKPLPLDAFSPKQETGSSTTRISRKGSIKVRTLLRTNKNPTAGVSIEVFKGKRELIPFAFLIPNGAARVFARGTYAAGTQHGFIERHTRINNTGNDTPVKPLITLSVFGSVLNDKVNREIGAKVKVDYPIRLEHELNYIIQKNSRISS